MSEKITLKPCPFCGGEARLYSDFEVVPVIDSNGAYVDADCYGGNTHWVKCSVCGADTEQFTVDYGDEDWAELSAQRAIAAWNRRVENEELDNLRKEREIMLEELYAYQREAREA